jgi:hypothetical protein
MFAAEIIGIASEEPRKADLASKSAAFRRAATEQDERRGVHRTAITDEKGLELFFKIAAAGAAPA